MVLGVGQNVRTILLGHANVLKRADTVDRDDLRRGIF